MALQSYEGLEVTLRNGLHVITINRPRKKNALTAEMYENLTAILNAAATDSKVIMTALTGTGDFYSSGNDIASAVNKFNNEDVEKAIKENCAKIRKFVTAFIDYPKVLVAVVNGPAIGIAATTLGLCDIVYASDKAYFLTPFTKLGLVAEGCSSYTFPRIMGSSKAGDMLYFGHQMHAQEAKECGLVSQIFPHDTLHQQVWPKLEQYARMPVKSMMFSKQLVRARVSDKLHKANEEECKQIEERMQSEDSLNAVLEFLRKKSKM